MSIWEKKKRVMEIIENTNDEKLLDGVLAILKQEEKRLSVKEIYDEAVKDYGDTLRRLAES